MSIRGWRCCKRLSGCRTSKPNRACPTPALECKSMVGRILTIVVLLLLFVVGWILSNPVRLLIGGERTEGVVVGTAVSPGSPGQDPLQSPMVEFVTSTGERVRVTGRAYSAWTPARVGDAVTVAYSPSQPRDAQLLLLSEFSAAGFLLGFTALILLLWMIGILVTGDSRLADPFHLLPAVIAHFRIDPVRFPAIFLLSVVVPVCGIGTYVHSKDALELRSKSIKTVGHVVGSRVESSRLNDGRTVSGEHLIVEYKDTSGTAYTIRRSLVAWLSRLKAGDEVEVIYPPRHPERGVVNTWDEIYPPAIFFGFMTLAFLVALGLVLRGALGASHVEPGKQRNRKASGVPAVATVIEANPEARILRYRIDTETRNPTASLDGFVSLENTLSDWKPSQTDSRLKKGDQFRAYLDPLNPGKKFHIDFSDRIGFNPHVKPMEEDEDEE